MTTEEKKSESYKGYVDKASYVESQVIGLKEQIDEAQGKKALSLARLLCAWIIGLSVVALGFAILISVALIAQNQGATWSAQEIFVYVTLGCLGVAILTPFGGLLVKLLTPGYY